MLSVVEELLIDATEIGQIRFQAFLGWKFRQYEALISAAKIIHQSLKLRIPAINFLALEDYVVFEDGFEEILAELVVACYLHRFLGLDAHHLGFRDLQQHLLGVLVIVDQVADSVFVDDVLLDNLKLFLWGKGHLGT